MSTSQQHSNYVVVSTPQNREAKKVIDYKVYNGKRYYKVKWESSWELEDSLSDYQDLIDQFWDFVKRVSNEEKDSNGRKRPRLDDDDDIQDDNDPSMQNSEDDIPIKGTITLSEGVKLQESGNFYRLTHDKVESVEHDDSTIFIVQGNQPTHIIKNRSHKGNVHVIGLQHEPKTTTTIVKKIRSDDNIDKPDFELTETDKEMGWDNPYVRLAFYCRVCNNEQPYDEMKWKNHFCKHMATEPRKPIEDQSEDVRKKKSSTHEVCSDQNIPWIQKVDHLIHSWGVNQYVRMAFLCRYCGKEQQTDHTGNWRNHYQLAHSLNDPVNCNVCEMSLRNKSALRKHQKSYHESPYLSAKDTPPVYNCQICCMPLQRKADVKKHIAEKHNINPENIPVRKGSQSKDIGETPSNDNDSTVKKVKVKMFPGKSSLEKSSPKKAQPKQTQTSSNRKFICGMCYASFKTKSEMKSHQSMVHFNQQNNTPIYKCTKCEKSFNKHIDLTNHTIDQHGIDDTIPGATMVPREEVSQIRSMDLLPGATMVPREEISQVRSTDVLHGATMVSREELSQIRTTERLPTSHTGDGDNEIGDLIVVIKEEEEDIPSDEKPPLN